MTRLATAPFLNLTGLRKLPVVCQSEAAECGLASLAMIAGYHGYHVDLATLRQRFSVSLKGATLKGLMEIAAGVGLGARPLRCELEELRDVRAPAILHWGLNHFVVLKRVRNNRVEIHDPADGARTLSLKEVSGLFSGVVLELTPGERFQRKQDRNPLRLGALVKLSPETFKALLQAVALSLLIELLVLATPFYFQFVIDEAILKGDGGLLGTLAVAFSLVLLFNVVATALRGLTLQFVSNVLAFDIGARVFHHLLRLPLDWFHKRQVGDVQSRFHAILPIQQFIADGAIAAIFDGVLGLLILALMFYYSPALAGVVLASALTYAALRLSMLEVSRRVAGDYLIAEAKEQTRFLEALRGIQTIKISAMEPTREGLQRNLIAGRINAGIRAGNVNIGYGALNQFLSGLTDVLVVYLGARAVMNTDLTVGMLTAFMAYKGQFAGRSSNLVEQLINWRLLDVHLERLSDIALQPKEAQIDAGSEGLVEGAIECRAISFRYSFGDSNVLQNVDLRVAAGEYVAITGPSGCGKSTLIKILAGLYQPSSGEVLVDGRSLRTWSTKALRAQIGFVCEEDQLFAGSIADNIGSFDEHINLERVEECARTAQIHGEILAMPMGYQSLVGDMGSTLSAGQKQRVILARALYRRPRVLILDESTSHLDVNNERAINDALSDLSITRVIVAHRPETIRSAHRVIRLGSGTAVNAEALQQAE